jgi:3-deoxy-manno-octulosonate cytidylyltransferase (CMP-KDO synthetase)
MRTIGVIPARYHSTRFPGKPLVTIAGKTMIERVWRQVMKARQIDEVIIATDHPAIVAAAKNFGARVLMTPAHCATGTDRLAAVARMPGVRGELFINIQGDEPLIDPRLIDRLVMALKKNPAIPAVTAAIPFRDPADAANPNIVKVVCDRTGRALYFSRAAVPYPRAAAPVPYLKHHGIYGYRRKFLLAFAGWRQTPLEKTEHLEQLRILENGYPMQVIVSRREAHGVDVPADVARIERLLQ